MKQFIDRFRQNHSKTFFRFTGVGVLNTGVDFIVFILVFYLLHWPLLVSHMTAFFVATINSYVLNKIWTFEDQKTFQIKQFLSFLLITVTGLGLSSLVIYTAHFYMPAFMAKVFAILVSLIWNYTGMRWFLFKSTQGPTRS